MSSEMSKITEQDLTLLYYGEHKDPGLAARVAQSDELAARFAALSAELELVDAYQPPERGRNMAPRSGSAYLHILPQPSRLQNCAWVTGGPASVSRDSARREYLAWCWWQGWPLCWVAIQMFLCHLRPVTTHCRSLQALTRLDC